MRELSINYAEELAKRCRSLARLLIPVIRYKAESCGYAVAVHGSLSRDIDLLAVPWREGAVGAASLIESVAEIVRAVHGDSGLQPQTFVLGPTAKPCGRLAWAIHLTPDRGAGPYLDISVFDARCVNKHA